MTEILKDLKNKIDLLEEMEKKEVFSLINKHNMKYTTNKNGVFVNMNLFTKEVIKDIINFLDFSKNNKKILEEREKLQNNIQNQHEETI